MLLPHSAILESVVAAMPVGDGRRGVPTENPSDLAQAIEHRWRSEVQVLAAVTVLIRVHLCEIRVRNKVITLDLCLISRKRDYRILKELLL
jgi:hypothetical protein